MTIAALILLALICWLAVSLLRALSAVAGLEIKCPSPFTHAEYIEYGAYRERMTPKLQLNA